MSLKQRNVRYTDEEWELVGKLADLMGVVELSNAVRQAVKEALEIRGVKVPETAFGKKQEGRPKENPPTALNRRRVYNKIAAMNQIAAVSL